MNFDMDVKEHQEKMKENIKKLENTTLFDRSHLKDIHLFFFYLSCCLFLFG